MDEEESSRAEKLVVGVADNGSDEVKSSEVGYF